MFGTLKKMYFRTLCTFVPYSIFFQLYHTYFVLRKISELYVLKKTHTLCTFLPYSIFPVVPYLLCSEEDFGTIKKVRHHSMYNIYTFVPYSLCFFSFTLYPERFFMLKKICASSITYFVCKNIPPSLYS